MHAGRIPLNSIGFGLRPYDISGSTEYFLLSYHYHNFLSIKLKKKVKKNIGRTITEDKNKIAVNNSGDAMSNSTDSASLKLHSDNLLDKIISG